MWQTSSRGFGNGTCTRPDRTISILNRPSRTSVTLRSIKNHCLPREPLAKRRKRRITVYFRTRRSAETVTEYGKGVLLQIKQNAIKLGIIRRHVPRRSDLNIQRQLKGDPNPRCFIACGGVSHRVAMQHSVLSERVVECNALVRCRLVNSFS